MRYNALTEYIGELICYHIQTNESIELSPQSRHDIFHKVRDLADYWKEDSDKLREENHALRWNELRLWLKRTEPDGYEMILATMERLDRKESVR
jgi:hypothetical protein